jgi:hypothetical protein
MPPCWTTLRVDHRAWTQTASEHCLRLWGMKLTVLDQRNPSDLHTFEFLGRSLSRVTDCRKGIPYKRSKASTSELNIL